MPDIREILNALSVDNRALWSEQRTIMRRAYLNAHNETVGIGNWTHEDDAFMDLIDIRLALLFDRAGLLDSTKEIIGAEQGTKIENDLIAKAATIGSKIDVKILPQEAMSAASKQLANGGWR